MKKFLYLLFIHFLHGCTSNNKVVNPGAELPPLQNGWISSQGKWTQRFKGPLPQEGKAYFFPSVAASAELYQDVDVSNYSFFIDYGFITANYSGYVRAYPQRPPDESSEMLEFRDSNGAVLDSFKSQSHDSTNSWVKISQKIKLPAATKVIRIKLLSKRNNGSNNDGYHDNISLTLSNSLVTYVILALIVILTLFIYLFVRKKRDKRPVIGTQ